MQPLQPTYGTPLSEGLGQLRVYNGFKCNFSLNINNTVDGYMATIPPLAVYQNLEVPVQNSTELNFTYKGEPGTECESIVKSGNFYIEEKSHSSYFISTNGLIRFVDDNDKAINGVNIR